MIFYCSKVKEMQVEIDDKAGEIDRLRDELSKLKLTTTANDSCELAHIVMIHVHLYVCMYVCNLHVKYV